MDLSASLQNLKDQPIEQHLEWASSRLPPWVAALLVIGIAWKLADISWILMNSDGADPAEIPPVITQSGALATQAASSFDAQLVASANLFGEFNESEVTPAVVDTGDLDDTNLPLTLNGTGASDTKEQAFALIEHNGKEKAYFVGDAIANGASLHAVHMDHAVLSRSGILEKLPRKTLSESKGSASPRRRVASRNRRSTPKPPSDNLGSLREELVANPAKFTDIVRPTPIYNNGKLAGYRVYPGRERQKFIEIGLKPGDLVTAINSTTLNDPAQGAKVFRELATASSVNLTVERAGQSMNITVDLGS